MTSNKNTGVPVSWPELVQKSTAATQYVIDDCESLSEKLLQKRDPEKITSNIGGCTLTLAAALVLLNFDDSKGAMKNWLLLLPESIRYIEPDLSKNMVWAYSLLSFVQIAECAGFHKPAEFDKQAYLKFFAYNQDALNHTKIQSLGFMSVLFGMEGLLPHFIGTDVPEVFQPGKIFQFDYNSFIAYLSAAMKNNAGWGQVEPAWEDFLTSFPYKYAANTSDWIHLLLAGSIVARLQGNPITSVPDYLHRKLTSR